MASKAIDSPQIRGFVLSRKAFAAITAVEGLRISEAGERRRKRIGLTLEQRRAEAIRAYLSRQGR
jgi:hypothetical protein